MMTTIVEELSGATSPTRPRPAAEPAYATASLVEERSAAEVIVIDYVNTEPSLRAEWLQAEKTHVIIIALEHSFSHGRNKICVEDETQTNFRYHAGCLGIAFPPARALHQNLAPQSGVLGYFEDQSSTSQPAWENLATAFEEHEVERAVEQLKRGRMAAKTGDMRLAYREAYRGLDVLFRCRRWTLAHAQLREACSDSYPAHFGIGLLRFSSEAAALIPAWSDLVELLSASARRQGMNTARALRGIVGNNDDASSPLG